MVIVLSVVLLSVVLRVVSVVVLSVVMWWCAECDFVLMSAGL